MGLEISIHVGEDVLELLSESSFLFEWDALYDTCPWATVFQSRKFVTSWYQIYFEKYEPIVVKGISDGKLAGLLTLAKDEDGLIFGAGEDQAEYQVWLARSVYGESFIISAVIECLRRFDDCKLQLRYIPAKAPFKWVKDDLYLKKCCMIKAYKQPFIKINDAELAKELKKKNRREKVNRLNRIGDLKFERVKDPEIFSSIIDELILQFDFRKMAMFNRAFFLDNFFRKKFLLSLFDNGLLHATVLRSNGEIIASNVGAKGKDCVHLQGINTIAPSYARYSPGILHFLMLGRLLADEGVSVFDLTPGENAYKDDLATDYGVAYELIICRNDRFFVDHARFYLVEGLKRISSKFGVQMATLRKLKRGTLVCKEKVSLAKRQKVDFWIKSVIRKIVNYWKAESCVIALNLAPFNPLSIQVNKNCLKDLLLYKPEGTWITTREFLETAMNRFEAGHKVYTLSEGDCLLCSVWYSDCSGAKRFGSVRYGIQIENDALFLQGFYCHPKGQSKMSKFLDSVVAKIYSDEKRVPVYAIISNNEQPFSKHLISEA